MDVRDLYGGKLDVGSIKAKRKADFSVMPSSEQLAKARKIDGPSAPASSSAAMPPPPLPANSKGKGRAVVTESSDDEDEGGAEGGANGSSYDPSNDGDFFAEEDAEGRFYGGGLNSTQKQILEILEGETDEDATPALTLQSVRRQLLNLEKAINKNREQRTKFASDPTKFVDSEVVLDAALHELLLLTQDAGTFYPELVRLNIVPSLIDLLSHENVDVAITVIEVLEELTDEDLGDSDEEEAAEAARQGVKLLIEALLDSAILELSVQHLSRLNEQEEPERQGVYHVLGLMENLVSTQPSVAVQLCSKTDILHWLLQRTSVKPVAGIAVDEADGAQNRQYAGELLAILLASQDSGLIRRLFGEKDGVDICLQILARYRKKDPVDAEETEYMENVFDALCSALSESTVKRLFLEAEGVELMVILMKEKKLAKTRSIKVLDHALTGDSGAESCMRFVDAFGLKTLFAAFMGKTSSKKAQVTSEDEEHILGVLVSLFSNLESDTEQRIRLLAKFVDEDYAKVDRLLEYMDQAEARVTRADAKATELELDEDEAYLERLEAGLSILQMASYILAWVIMEDDGIRDHAKMLLRRRSQTFGKVVAVLNDYRANIAEAPIEINGNAEEQHSESAELTGGARQRDIIERLSEYLATCDA